MPNNENLTSLYENVFYDKFVLYAEREMHNFNKQIFYSKIKHNRSLELIGITGTRKLCLKCYLIHFLYLIYMQFIKLWQNEIHRMF